MPTYTLNINGKKQEVQAEEDSILLWALRDQLGLTGTKYGCGIGQCGSCTVHVNGDPVRSCTITVSAVAGGQALTTIEGLSKNNDHPLQQAWIKKQVPQCGYCQSGQIMQAAALLEKTPKPTRREIMQYMNGNLCRCGTYLRVLQAIELAAESKVLSLKEK